MSPALTEPRSVTRRSVKERSRRILDPVVSLLFSRGVSPFAVSAVGLAAAAVAAIAIVRGSLFWGGLWTLFSGACDVVDGGLARRAGRETKFGAFIDSMFDRVSEMFVYGALLVYFADKGHPRVLLVVIFFAMTASFLVSYARARIEGLGGTCRVGLFERPERFFILVVGLLAGRIVAVAALVVIALGASFTVVERVFHARRVTGNGNRSADG